MVFRQKLTAFVAPMVVFMALLLLRSVLPSLGSGFWAQRSEYWVFPLQTIVCGALLWRFWPAYEIRRPRQVGVGIGVGLLVLVLWIAPQSFLGFPARTEGFNPDVFAGQPIPYWLTVIFRFLRLVVVVPLVEEIFWRGFLLRYLINEKFEQVPFGTFSWLSFLAVTFAFCLAHTMPDWPAAVVTGALYNWVAYRTKSLSTCVVTHAVTNFGLGLWIMSTKQWGFW
ncbi:MAG TPA: CAAX prenyl protease-related protein [Chthoniobacterales bacterium]|nr:CAAX prenyl protease-related protein [Chthoniobacterales bacterium]